MFTEDRNRERVHKEWSSFRNGSQEDIIRLHLRIMAIESQLWKVEPTEEEAQKVCDLRVKTGF